MLAGCREMKCCAATRIKDKYPGTYCTYVVVEHRKVLLLLFLTIKMILTLQIHVLIVGFFA